MKKYFKPEISVYEINVQTLIAGSSLHIDNNTSFDDESQFQKRERRSAWDEYERNW